MQKALIIFSSLTILAIGIWGCRKRSNPAPATPAKYTGCRISRITQWGYDSANSKIVYDFDYNNDGTVSRITIPAQHLSDPMVKTFTYKPNCIIVYTTDNSLPFSTDSLLLDGNNRVIFIENSEYSGSPQPNQVWEYQYDSLGNMVYQTYHSYNTNTTASYSWKNGDLQWNTSGTDVVDYYYDTTLYNVGNIYTRITDFISYGRSIYPPSKHLHSYAIEDGNDTSVYTYNLDNTGKVTNVDISTSLTPLTEINYTCE